MYKIGIIGERDSVLCFMALGFSVFPTESSEEAGKILHKLATVSYTHLTLPTSAYV